MWDYYAAVFLVMLDKHIFWKMIIKYEILGNFTLWEEIMLEFGVKNKRIF